MNEVMVEICCEHSGVLVANYLHDLAIPEKPVAGFETSTQSQQGPLRRIWSLGALGDGVRLGSEGSSVGGGVWKFGVQKMKKIKNLKIQIRSAQNVGKVWISRKKILPALFGAI